MPLTELKETEFETFIEKNHLVFIDFWAPWCEPCKQFGQVYEKVAQESANIQFVKVNVEKEQELAKLLEIRSIPHLMIFKDGIAIYSEAGSMPESILKNLIEQAMNADLTEIKNEIDEGKL